MIFARSILQVASPDVEESRIIILPLTETGIESAFRSSDVSQEVSCLVADYPSRNGAIRATDGKHALAEQADIEWPT